MQSLVQKKVLLDRKQMAFLSKYKEFGFRTQGSMVRYAVNELIEKTQRQHIKDSLAKGAQKVTKLYKSDTDLTAFTCLDSEGFNQ